MSGRVCPARGRVLVRGSEGGTWKIVFRVLGLGLVAFAAVLWLQLRDGGWAVVAAGAGLAVLGVNDAVAIVRLRARRWVEDTGSGLRVIEPGADYAVADDQVTDLKLVHVRRHSAGELKRVDRRLTLWVEGRPGPITMQNRIPAGGADPLAGLIDRLIENLKTRTAEKLLGGQPLESEDWRLERHQLSVRERGQWRTVSFSDLETVGLFSGKWCLWRKGQDEPFARIDPGSRNAPILAVLVGEWTSHKEEAAKAGAGPNGDSPPQSPAGAGLGRVLFERHWRLPRAVMAVLAAALLGVGAFLALDSEARGAGILLLAGGAIPAALAWYGPFTTFRCHELGVARRTRRRQAVMRYADMTEFTYQATRHFVNGSYTGTSLAMKFRSPRGEINYSANAKVPDEDLDELRDHIAKVIASRMVRQLAAGEAVPWTGDLVLLPQGLQFRPGGFLGRKPPEVLPYERIRGFDMQQGVFFVWSQESEKPVIRQPVSAPNFFPGFYALLVRQSPEEGAREA